MLSYQDSTNRAKKLQKKFSLKEWKPHVLQSFIGHGYFQYIFNWASASDLIGVSRDTFKEVWLYGWDYNENTRSLKIIMEIYAGVLPMQRLTLKDYLDD